MATPHGIQTPWNECRKKSSAELKPATALLTFHHPVGFPFISSIADLDSGACGVNLRLTTLVRGYKDHRSSSLQLLHPDVTQTIPKQSLFAVALALFPGTYAGFSGKTCRIMPLGTSITFGVGSTDGNGYRAALYNLLATDGNTVNMVGSQKGGNFKDPDNEGYPGFIISQNVDVGNAPARLTTLIQDVLDAPTLTLVVLSTLPPNGDAATNTRINAYNAALPAVVRSFTDAGRSVVLVDSRAVVAVGDLVDGTHPNDAAYARMATVFYNGIQAANANGWIFDVDGPPPRRGMREGM
ncbi:FG-GAP repeat domain-containing protein [Mycena venus]|uniref:FG-GAP repeat domain-containing protein n=1 Tax=Mycena venus TaxID=2733690 RepID=A0A8H6XEM0_9AGAR|nr:FG-GAP repeat domain-containing protein [Mycena venus]